MPSYKINSQSATKELLCPLWTQKVHCYVHNSLPLCPFWIKYSVHNHPPHLSKISFNIIFLSDSVFQQASSLQLLQSKLCKHFSYLPCIPPPPNLTLIIQTYATSKYNSLSVDMDICCHISTTLALISRPPSYYNEAFSLLIAWYWSYLCKCLGRSQNTGRPNRN
jgi:hypothetical protein